MKDGRLYGRFTLDFPDNYKVMPLSDAAFRCLVEATLWSRKQMSDGVLARRYAVARWGLEVLNELASNDPDNPSFIEQEDGWLIRDFDEHQDTRAEIEARSARNKLAGQRGGQARAKRSAKRVASTSLSETQAETETETETKNKEQTSCSTELNPVEQASAVVQPAYPADFSAWWDVYPRRQSKRPAAAAFAKAKKRATVDQLIAGARRYAADPHRVAEFTKLPATWLNGDCWDDAPLPARGQSSRTQSQAGWDAIRHDFQPPHPQIGA